MKDAILKVFKAEPPVMPSKKQIKLSPKQKVYVKRARAAKKQK